MPSMYFDEYSTTGDNKDLSYQQIFGPASDTNQFEYHGIPKVYYGETYLIYDATGDVGGIQRSFIDNQGKSHSSILYPMMGDSVGEGNDIMYLKNRSMIKTGLDFTVGALGMTSNP
jgi:hypothetical protein